MDNNQESKKAFCARCFLPIGTEDKVDVEGQNFHKMCSMCCICRMIPTSLKMFYGHVFCNDCFKNHVMTKYRGQNPSVQSNSWWSQWAPGTCPQEKADVSEDSEIPKNPTGSTKKVICTRCLQPVEENQRIMIGNQNFHVQCGQCYICQQTPTDNLKIYYGQVFCENCFHRLIFNKNKDNPSEFFKNCFEQWQNNPQFSANMKDFMAGNKESSPFIFLMQGQQPPFCRCGTGPQEWFHPNEPKKSATPAITHNEKESSDLIFEDRTDISVSDSVNEESAKHFAAEKIEKLSKYLVTKTNEQTSQLWKFLEQNQKRHGLINGWVNIQSEKINSSCPKCLWQSGPIYVNNEYSIDYLD